MDTGVAQDSKQHLEDRIEKLKKQAMIFLIDIILVKK